MKKTLLAVALGALIAGPAMAAQDTEKGDSPAIPLQWQVDAVKSSSSYNGVTIEAKKGKVHFGNTDYADAQFKIEIENGINYKKAFKLTASLASQPSELTTEQDSTARIGVNKIDFRGSSTVGLEKGTSDSALIYGDDGTIDVYGWKTSLQGTAGSKPFAYNDVRFYMTDFFVGNNTTDYEGMPSGNYEGNVYVNFKVEWEAATP